MSPLFSNLYFLLKNSLFFPIFCRFFYFISFPLFPSQASCLDPFLSRVTLLKGFLSFRNEGSWINAVNNARQLQQRYSIILPLRWMPYLQGSQELTRVFFHWKGARDSLHHSSLFCPRLQWSGNCLSPWAIPSVILTVSIFCVDQAL